MRVVIQYVLIRLSKGTLNTHTQQHTLPAAWENSLSLICIYLTNKYNSIAVEQILDRCVCMKYDQKPQQAIRVQRG